MGLYEITQKYLNKERIFLNETQQELKNLPQGTLQRKNKKGGAEYYTRKEGTQLYIPKKQFKLVNDLKRRRVLEEAESIAKGNIMAMEHLLKEYKPLDFDKI